MSTSTLIHQLNRQYSLNMAANTLFNRLRDDASKSSLSELTFRDMVAYSRSAKLFSIQNHNHKNGINGHSHSNHTNSHLIESAEYVRKQLLIIIARIIIDFQNLPYGVSDNPRIEQSMQSYIDSYTALKQIPSIKCKNDKILFHELLERYLSSWTQISAVPSLCLGLLEMAQQKHLQKIEECPYLSNFIDRIITRRLAARVLLGHYMALHDQDWGIFEENCDVSKYIETAKNDAIEVANKVYTDDKMLLPKIKISDMRKKETSSGFVFCPKMIHQFAFELIKNSIRATMEFHGEDSGENDINIIIINSNNGDVTIKVGDTGGGISRSEMNKIFLYSYTSPRYSKKHRVDFKKNRDKINGSLGTHRESNHEHGDDNGNGKGSQIELLEKTIKIDKYAVTSNPYYIGAVVHDHVPMYGLGYGLPLVKAYSEYFGGWCNLHSIDGYGTDAYLFLPTLATSKSNVLSE